MPPPLSQSYDVTGSPDVVVAFALNVTLSHRSALPPWLLLIVTGTAARAPIVIALDVTNVSPDAVALAVTIYVPASEYAWVTLRAAVTVPRSLLDPSPHSRTTLGVVPAPGVTVNTTVAPTVPESGPVSVRPAAAEPTLTDIAVLKLSPSAVDCAVMVYEPDRW